MKKCILVLVLFFSLFVFSGDPVAGKASYITCTACHGADGAGLQALNSPAIAGQETWYLETQLKNYKAGVRGAHAKDIYGMQMRPMAMTLPTAEAVANVAAYVNSLKPVKSAQTIKGDVNKGKALYAICVACHGPEGKGLQPLNSPNLTLQQDWYMVRQLQNFKAGIRGADAKDVFGMQMRPMAMTLPDDQAINDVVAYIITLAK